MASEFTDIRCKKCKALLFKIGTVQPDGEIIETFPLSATIEVKCKKCKLTQIVMR